MSWMELYFAIKTIVPLVFLGILAVLALLVFGWLGIANLITWFKRRCREGWCKHDYELHSTFSYGSKAKYKCKKCGAITFR